MTSGKLDRDAMLAAADVYRRELVAHCYRMVGSIHDAQDLVQETYLRAWRGWDGFEGRSSLRTWLYRIATNLCLTAVQHSRHRVLPAGLSGPATDPDTPLAAAPDGTRWVEPFPSARYEEPGADPAEIVAFRSSLRLALIASLQHLPPLQRAVFLLREVLAFRASDVADLLDTTVPAVKSALQRARAKLDEVMPSAEATAEPDTAAARGVLDRYMAAFERTDIAALTDLLATDARLEIVPTSTWFAGNAVCVPYLARHVITTPGRYRMVATVANGQPAAIAYVRQHPDGEFEPFGIAVLSTEEDQLTSVTAYLDASLVAHFTGTDSSV